MEKPIDELQEYEIKNLHQEIDDLKIEIEKFKELIKPLCDTYSTSVILGKWIMGLLVFISILIGVILGLRSLWK